MPTPLDLILAALPIVTLLVLLCLRVKPLPAVIGAIVALLLLSFRFPIGASEALEMSGRLSYVTINIVFILLGGLVLSVFMEESGAQQRMSVWFESATNDRDRAILLYGLGLTPLLESTIGWGVSLIVAIPLLLRSGVSPSRAISVAVLGLVVCPWGSLGPGLILTSELGQIDLHALGTASAIYNAPLILVIAAAIAVVGVGKRMTVALCGELLAVTIMLAGVLILANWLLSPMLAGVLASIAATLTFLVFARINGANLRMNAGQALAFVPIGILVVSMLIAVALDSALDLGSFGRLITSPGLWMMVAAASAPPVFRMQLTPVLACLRRGVRNWVPACATTLLYVVFGVLLSVSGMSGTLAEGAASSGMVFIAALPFIGFLAGYLTVSNTSIGTMLTFGVVEAATAIGTDPAAALGALTAAGGGGVGASPARLALAVSVVRANEAPSVRINTGRIILVSVSANLVAASIISVMMLVAPL